MTEKRFEPVYDDNEYNILGSDLGSIETEFKSLVEDYQYLTKRLMDVDKPITDGEIDWLGITDLKINAVYRFIYSEFSKLKGSDTALKMQLAIDNQDIIKQLYDKIHEQRKLNIENDPVLRELSKQVRQLRILSFGQ
ncbi:MAG: hypothetical protein PHG15_10795 [Acinetobacter sp.]|uniref:hypothetical protein n=1 Tax=Acinetobacter sp. TaxID=472 RepID=UPI00260AA508|nr:hypothetical protein [Acinetobacter sp.]MDD2946251.1 hypothetical protein [Acinetobacter sp.]